MTGAFTVPAHVAKRSCYNQHFDAWCIESRFASEAQAVLRNGGVAQMLQLAKENPPTEFTPAIYGLMEQFASSEVSTPEASHAELDDAESDFGPPPYFIFQGTGIIPVTGPITKYPSSTSSLFGGSVSTGMRKALAMAVADEKVERILFAIDSPGGMAAGTGDLADDIFRARSQKPIAAHISDMGASAAYWIASQTNHISASRHGEVGSVGVLQVLEDASRAAEGAGIEVLVFQSVPGKAKYVYGTEVTRDQRKFFQDRVEDIHALFADSVSRGRGADFSKKADGRFLMAAEALKQGFIDSIGNLRESLEAFTASTRTSEAKDTPPSDATSVPHWSQTMSTLLASNAPEPIEADVEANHQSLNTPENLGPTRSHMADSPPDTQNAAQEPIAAGAENDSAAIEKRLDALLEAKLAEREAKAEEKRVASLRAEISEEFDIDAAELASHNTVASLEATRRLLSAKKRTEEAGARGAEPGGRAPKAAVVSDAVANYESKEAERKAWLSQLSSHTDMVVRA